MLYWTALAEGSKPRPLDLAKTLPQGGPERDMERQEETGKMSAEVRKLGLCTSQCFRVLEVELELEVWLAAGEGVACVS